MVNNSSKLNQLVFIDSFPHQLLLLLPCAFWVVSVNRYGLKVINLKETGNECLNFLLNKNESGFSPVLCLPFVFHRALLLSLVFHPFPGFRFYFFSFSSYVFYLFQEELYSDLTDMLSIPSLQCWARSTIYFMFVFLLSIACSQCSLVWFDNCFQKYI